MALAMCHHEAYPGDDSGATPAYSSYSSRDRDSGEPGHPPPLKELVEWYAQNRVDSDPEVRASCSHSNKRQKRDAPNFYSREFGMYMKRGWHNILQGMSRCISPWIMSCFELNFIEKQDHALSEEADLCNDRYVSTKSFQWRLFRCPDTCSFRDLSGH